MKTEVHRRPFGTMESPRFVVMLSCMNGAILLGRHEGRDTWETQGGHIEPGETPEQAARRELYEECGAVKYTLTPLFDYWVGLESSSGCAFAAQIEQFCKKCRHLTVFRAEPAAPNRGSGFHREGFGEPPAVNDRPRFRPRNLLRTSNGTHGAVDFCPRRALCADTAQPSRSVVQFQTCATCRAA